MLKTNWIYIAAALFCLIFLAGCGAAPEDATTMTTSASVTQETVIIETTAAETTSYVVEETEETTQCTVFTEPAIDSPIPGEEWYRSSRLIYHACGGVDKAEYTNSREAMEETLSMGNMLIEVDFLFTSDGHLVCAHEWDDVFGYERNCTLEEFLAQKIRGKYSGMTAEDIIKYMEANPALYIIVDTKEPDVTGVVAELLRLCASEPDIANRFVIQLYDRGVKEQMLELYPFWDENFLFTCYKFGPQRVTEILELCREEGIQVVTVPYGSWGQETVNRFLEEGIVLFEHTVNFTSMTDLSLKKGIYGFYTDYLQEGDLNISGE